MLFRSTGMIIKKRSKREKKKKKKKQRKRGRERENEYFSFAIDEIHTRMMRNVDIFDLAYCQQYEDISKEKKKKKGRSRRRRRGGRRRRRRRKRCSDLQVCQFLIYSQPYLFFRRVKKGKGWRQQDERKERNEEGKEKKDRKKNSKPKHVIQGLGLSVLVGAGG